MGQSLQSIPVPGSQVWLDVFKLQLIDCLLLLLLLMTVHMWATPSFFAETWRQLGCLVCNCLAREAPSNKDGHHLHGVPYFINRNIEILGKLLSGTLPFVILTNHSCYITCHLDGANCYDSEPDKQAWTETGMATGQKTRRRWPTDEGVIIITKLGPIHITFCRHRKSRTYPPTYSPTQRFQVTF